MIADSQRISTCTGIPWKIFVYLLDKWEIGGLLTDCLAYDALVVCYESFMINSSKESEVYIPFSELYVIDKLVIRSW